MKTVFADTFYFLALYYPDDQYHAKTVSVGRQLKARLLTTDWILTEVVDALSKGRSRSEAADLIHQLRESSIWEIVPFSRDQFDAALEFHFEHQDKDWTLTDCASFLLMRERGITEALTGDHHFEQAGFTALLK